MEYVELQVACQHQIRGVYGQVKLGAQKRIDDERTRRCWRVEPVFVPQRQVLRYCLANEI